MVNLKLHIVSEITRLAKSSRGRDLSLLHLTDDCLHQVYQQMNAGVSNRSIARMLQTKYGISRSENALQQSLSALRKRIAPLLSIKENGLPSKPIRPPSELSSMDPEDSLVTVDEILKAYGNSIEMMAKAAECNDGMLTEDLSKHVKAYSTLLGIRHRLQSARKQEPSSQSREDLERERKSKLALEKYIGNDGNRMLRAADNFLKAIEEKCVALEQDPETGEYREVETA